MYEPAFTSLANSEVNCKCTPVAPNGERNAATICCASVFGAVRSTSVTPKNPLRMRTVNLPGRVTFNDNLWKVRRPVLGSKVELSGR